MRDRLTCAGCAGITERFGDDIFEYLEKHGQMEVTWPSSDPSSGGKKKWMLLHQVLSLPCPFRNQGRSMYPSNFTYMPISKRALLLLGTVCCHS